MILRLLLITVHICMYWGLHELFSRTMPLGICKQILSDEMRAEVIYAHSDIHEC